MNNWRVRLLHEIIQIGNLIASPRTIEEDHGENVRVTTTYAWWYRPIVAWAFWLCQTKDGGDNGV